MSFSIEDFKSNGLIYGGARPSLFRVYIPVFPGPFDGSTANESRKISLLAKAASIPPSKIDSIDVPYFSRKIRVNGDRSFPDWTITIMNDEDFRIRKAMEDWHQFINSRAPNRQAGDDRVSNYKVDLVVHQYGKNGEFNSDSGSQISQSTSAGDVDDASAIASYTFVGAFPTDISAIGLDWDAVNQIEQFDITFSYDYWEPHEIVASAASTISSQFAPTS